MAVKHHSSYYFPIQLLYNHYSSFQNPESSNQSQCFIFSFSPHSHLLSSQFPESIQTHFLLIPNLMGFFLSSGTLSLASLWHFTLVMTSHQQFFLLSLSNTSVVVLLPGYGFTTFYSFPFTQKNLNFCSGTHFLPTKVSISGKAKTILGPRRQQSNLPS